MTNKAIEVLITGIVQGVGFRPFIHNLAESLSLNGIVRNSDSDVIIEVEGSEEALNKFVNKIKSNPPPLAKIKETVIKPANIKGYCGFKIIESIHGENNKVFISPDVGMCSDCENELLDFRNRRYMYPFINCTNCGPRFSIIKGVPYDRPLTTMAKFNMCKACEAEYMDPGNRRYHAQPTSCYHCGPKLSLLDSKGKNVDVPDIMKQVQILIKSGNIVAIKGIGGYHLVCDAKNPDAVKLLRKRKHRDEKPFALMAKDYYTANIYCYINQYEKKLIESSAKPIVLLKKRQGIILPEEIAPGNPNMGIMLPYTAVHKLLFSNSDGAKNIRSSEIGTPIQSGEDESECTNSNMLKLSESNTENIKYVKFLTENNDLEILVATSGNLSSEPIYYKDEEAIENLRDIADYFLTNDREIYIRTDDSVTRIFMDKEYIVRRSRGYVPSPITLDFLNGKDVKEVLAAGGELKNTFCLNKGNEFYISHHIGDLENVETMDSFTEGVEHYKRTFGITPKIAAMDLHPEYLSSKYVRELNIPHKIQIQHHHAHIASCMAENNLAGNVIGVAFDGTGYGLDGNIWGGEFFTGSYSGFKREASLEYVKMPGGEKAIKEPWRMAIGYLYNVFGKNIDIVKVKKLFPDVASSSIDVVIKMLEKNINCPETSSMGRFFDAAAALCRVKSLISYEGQAAIEFENVSDKNEYEPYIYKIITKAGFNSICTKDTIKGIIDDISGEKPVSYISSRFHSTVADIVIKTCELIRRDSGLNSVALSGGVFQNMNLLDRCIRDLKEKNFNVYIHSRVPANDGGICLGQAVMALYGLKNK